VIFKKLKKCLVNVLKDIIIDTDIGDDIDDAYAIAFALNSPELNLKAVTTVYGNVDVRTRLVLKLLKTFKRRDIPVATGIKKPFMERNYQRDRYLGEHVPDQAAVITDKESLPTPSSMHAVDLIISSIMGSENEVTIIPIGALTNVATAIIMEPNIVKESNLVMMGGTITRPRRPFLSQFEEHNIRCDPEAARIVFESGMPITMVGLDVTLKCILTEEQIYDIKNMDLDTTKLLSNMTEIWMKKSKRPPTLHDPLAVAVSFDPTLVQTQPKLVKVVTAIDARGFTLASDSDAPNARVCFDVDSKRFVEIFMERILDSNN
jgi:inosine-uridine nucleoside N-ribohydrolase